MRQLDGGVKDFLIECNGVSHPPVWPFMADDYWAFTGDREALRDALDEGRGPRALDSRDEDPRLHGARA